MSVLTLKASRVKNYLVFSFMLCVVLQIFHAHVRSSSSPFLEPINFSAVGENQMLDNGLSCVFIRARAANCPPGSKGSSLEAEAGIVCNVKLC